MRRPGRSKPDLSISIRSGLRLLRRRLVKGRDRPTTAFRASAGAMAGRCWNGHSLGFHTGKLRRLPTIVHRRWHPGSPSQTGRSVWALLSGRYSV